DATEQRFGVRDGWRTAVGRGKGELTPLRSDDPVAKRPRQQPERPPERGTRNSLQRLLLVRVAARGAADAGIVERQGRSDHRYPAGQLPLDRHGELPPLRGAGLEQR